MAGVKGRSGGARRGAGRKPKLARILSHPASSAKQPPPDVVPGPVDEFDAPNELTVDERNVWLRLAPEAFRRRTLNKTTQEAFILLCRVVVLERNEAKSSGVGGANHRGLIRLMEDGLDAFGLRPQGKPMYEEEAPAADEKKAAYW